MSMTPVPFAPPVALLLFTAPAGSGLTSCNVPGSKTACAFSASISSRIEKPLSAAAVVCTRSA
jgi:hypothetical protein